MQSALEQSFSDICEKHDLTALSIHFHRGNSQEFFTAYAHAAGSFCTSANGDAISGALSAAVGEINAKRGKAERIALPDEALPEVAVLERTPA